MSDPLPERGGRSRRYYHVSAAGLAALRAARDGVARAVERRRVPARDSHETHPAAAAAPSSSGRCVAARVLRRGPRRSARGVRGARRDPRQTAPRAGGTPSAVRCASDAGQSFAVTADRFRPSPSRYPREQSRRFRSCEAVSPKCARTSVRSMVKRPALSALIVIPLALGLGANAAIFALIDAVILRPFTIPDIDRLVMIARDRAGRLARHPAKRCRRPTISTGSGRSAPSSTWRPSTAGMSTWPAPTKPERVSGFFVTAGFLRDLGVAPALGRTFTPDEETRGNHQRAVLSHDLWQRRFAGDRGIIGRTVLLDSEQFEIVGVAPAGFAFPLGADLWAPLAFDAKEAAKRDARYLSVIGKLAGGRGLDDAKSEMAVVAQRLEQQYPEANEAAAPG